MLPGEAWPVFQEEKEVAHISVQVFHAMIIAMCQEYADKMEQTDIAIIPKERKMLEELNFKNSRNYLELAEAKKRMVEIRRFFAFKKLFPNSMFMRLTDFSELCRKYKLVCGHVSEYTGDIPMKCLEEIYEATKVCKSDNLISWTINSGISVVDKITLSGSRDNMRISELEKRLKYSHIMQEDEIRSYNGIRGVIGISSRKMEYYNMLIAADGKLMKEVKFDEIPVQRPTSWVNGDPIVFQIIPGNIVMIHSKWGDEAEDPMFEKNAI